MDVICPLCNGLVEVQEYCSTCGSFMKDQGPVVDYLDDYSPYLSNDITQLVDGAPHNQCTHLFSCPECNTDKRVKINRVRI